MSATDSFFAQWYFHVPNLLLAALMYTLMGRFILSFFFRPDSTAVIWRVFCQITDPVVSTVGFVTPRVVPWPLLVVMATLWVLLARILLLVVLTALGLAPRTA